MDQNFNGHQTSTPTSPNPQPLLVPTPTTFTPKPPSKSGPIKQKTILVLISVIVLVSFALTLTSLLMASKKLDKTEQASQAKGIEKRLAAIEEADKYTEKQVDSGKYQAVFLNGGQVYFGKITEVTRDTMKLENIFYLKTGSVDRAGNPTTGTDVSLVKLGAELHAPEDVMLIERKNLLFWENLKTDGQVPKAIVEYKKANR